MLWFHGVGRFHGGWGLKQLELGSASEARKRRGLRLAPLLTMVVSFAACATPAHAQGPLDLLRCIHGKNGQIATKSLFMGGNDPQTVILTNLRALAGMAQRADIANFRIEKFSCRTVVMGSVQGDTECHIVAVPSAEAGAIQLDRVEKGSILSTAVVLSQSRGRVYPVPTDGIQRFAKDRCPPEPSQPTGLDAN